MAHSTSPASLLLEAERFGLPALERFYRFHARIYDWTRPLLLFGRRRVLRGLDVRPGHRVLDVGSGTGLGLERMLRVGAQVVGIEPSAAMRERARQRVARLQRDFSLDERPYGSHADYAGAVDRVLFSYSLAMIPPFEDALRSAHRDLRGRGRVGVVDFLDAEPLTGWALRRSHVRLGPERLAALRDLFPRHRLEVRHGLSWRYFLFWGDVQ